MLAAQIIGPTSKAPEPFGASSSPQMQLGICPKIKMMISGVVSARKTATKATKIIVIRSPPAKLFLVVDPEY
jgi:hypothetical protein